MPFFCFNFFTFSSSECWQKCQGCVKHECKPGDDKQMERDTDGRAGRRADRQRGRLNPTNYKWGCNSSNSGYQLCSAIVYPQFYLPVHFRVISKGLNRGEEQVNPLALNKMAFERNGTRKLWKMLVCACPAWTPLVSRSGWISIYRNIRQVSPCGV